MILYVDTSALVPLVISEKSSDICGQIWDPADRITTARLAYVETAAALAAAERLGRLTVGQRAASREILDELWGAVDVIDSMLV